MSTGKSKGEVYQSLIRAEASIDLKSLIRDRLRVDPAAVPGGSFAERARTLVEYATTLDRLDNLAVAIAALTAQPVDDDHPPVPARDLRSVDDLVKLRDLGGIVQDTGSWFDEMNRILRCVCRLKIGYTPATAFLVAPGVLLTNYHVVADYIESDRVVPAPPITAWFDYEFSLVAGEEGELHRLADDWLIAHSPRSAADEESEPRTTEAGLDELDYALLRLRDAPGDQRGYIRLPREGLDLWHHQPLTIVQFPDVSAVAVAFAPDGAQVMNQLRTRVSHRVNTDESSSGSPVFDKDWRLVALHRGYIKVPLGQEHQHNEAIPIDTIRDHFLNNPEVSPQARAEVGWG